MSFYNTQNSANFIVKNPILDLQQNVRVLKEDVNQLQINNELLLTLGPNAKQNVETFLQQKISGNAAFVSAVTSRASSQGIHGAYACFGNAFTEEQEFVSVGAAKSDGSPYTLSNTPILWASSSKMLTSLAFGKCLEEGLLNLWDEVSPFIVDHPNPAMRIPEFSGNFTYITSVTGYYTSTGSYNLNPFTWTISTGTVNASDLRIQNLLAMNLGIQYPFTLVGSPGALTYDVVNALDSLKYYPGTIAPAQTYLAYKTLQQLNFGGLQSKDWQVWNKESNPITFVQSFKNAISYCKSGTLPLIYKPSNFYGVGGSSLRATFQNTPDFNVTTTNNIYSPCWELLAYVIDSKVREVGYSSFTDYVKKKIFIPMEMTNSYVLGQVQIPASVRAASPTPQVSRNQYLLSPSSVGYSSLINTTIGYKAPGYTGASLLPFVTYWGDDTTGGLNTDSLVYSYNYNLNEYDPNDIPAGGEPLVSSISDFCKLLKLFINKGYYGKTQIINSATVDFLKTYSVMPMTRCIFARYNISVTDGSNYSWCNGGFQKVNNVFTNQAFASSEQCSFSGINNSVYLFDPLSGYYMVCGSQCNGLGYIDSAGTRAANTGGAIQDKVSGIADGLFDGQNIKSKMLQCMLNPI